MRQPTTSLSSDGCSPLHVLALVLAILSPASIASGQATANPPPQPAAPSPAMWSFRATAGAYVFPHDDDYVEPVVAADRGTLHLEARYNYEARASVSGFVGWNFHWGDTVTLEVTPMIGAVTGRLDGVIPAYELTLGVHRFEIYSEGEFFIDPRESRNHFLYSWSEFTVRPTDRLRVGFVTDRTRTFQQPRSIDRGVLAGVSVGKAELTAHVFEPWSGERFFLGSVAVSF